MIIYLQSKWNQIQTQEDCPINSWIKFAIYNDQGNSIDKSSQPLSKDGDGKRVHINMDQKNLILDVNVKEMNFFGGEVIYIRKNSKDRRDVLISLCRLENYWPK